MLYPVITKATLKNLYTKKSLSMMQISKQLGCSHHKVAYWMAEYKIERRSMSQAIYLIHNPKGDPFKLKAPNTVDEYILYGLGVGLYWKEGNKANRNAVRIGNSDPGLLRCYMVFLTELCGVSQDSLKFELHLFSDINVNTALRYWCRMLDVKKEQFYTPRVTLSGSLGTYKNKSKYGVVTIYFGNTKLRDILVEQITGLASIYNEAPNYKKLEPLSRHSLVVEHTHGKREVPSSILGVGSRSTSRT